MAAHLKLVDEDFLARRRARPPVEPPERRHPGRRRTSHKLSFDDVIVAIVAGVLAAWITDL